MPRKTAYVKGKRRHQYYTRRYNKTNPNITPYLQSLKQLYPSYTMDQTCLTDKYSGHQVTYGEMLYEGIDKLYNHSLHYFEEEPCAFLDIGCGRGKLCLHMANYSNITKSLGIELVKERYDDAVKLHSILAHRFPEYTNKTTFININVLYFSFSSFFNTNKPVFAWFSNLCFDSDITTQIFDKISKEFPKGSIICCSKICHGVSCNTKLKLLCTLPIPMSWSETSNVYMYKIV
jgi:hypothetical protein